METAGALKLAWKEGAGTPTKGILSLDSTYGVQGATKHFGVSGQGTTPGLGYDSNWRSELYNYKITNDPRAAWTYG